MDQTNYKYSDEQIKKWFLNTVKNINWYSHDLIKFFTNQKKSQFQFILWWICTGIILFIQIPVISNFIHNYQWGITFWLIFIFMTLFSTIDSIYSTDIKKFLIIDYLKDGWMLSNIDYNNIQNIHNSVFYRYSKLITLKSSNELFRTLFSFFMILIFVTSLIFSYMEPTINTIWILIVCSLLLVITLKWYNKNSLNQDYLTFLFLDNYEKSNSEILELAKSLWESKKVKVSFLELSTDQIFRSIPKDLLDSIDFTRFDKNFDKSESSFIKSIIKLAYVYETYKQMAIEKNYSINENLYKNFKTK